ncbi:hypothetical protein Tco_0942986 [Tanacetum coccineum]
MANSNTPPPPPALTLVEKLYAVHNINSLVPEKLDLQESNYSTWSYFFKGHCSNFNVLNHIDGSTSTSDPPTDEWITADSIVKSWIFLTLSPTLRKRMISTNPASAKAAWDTIGYQPCFNLQKSVVSLSYSSTNKAFQVTEDPPCLKPFLNGKHELLSSFDIFPCSKPCVQTRIHPVDLEFLDSVVQCLINLLQSAIAELVDLIEAHDHLNPIFIPECDGSWRVNYGKVMIELKTSCIPSRFGEVECGSENLLICGLEGVQVDLEGSIVQNLQVTRALRSPSMCVCQSKSLIFGTTSERIPYIASNVYFILVLQSTSDRVPFALSQHQDNRLLSFSRWTTQVCYPCYHI